MGFLRSIYYDKAKLLETFLGYRTGNVVHEVARGILLLGFFHDRYWVSNPGAFVDGYFIDDLHFLGNRGIGFVDKASFDIAGLHRSQGRADILYRNHLWLDLIPEALVGQVFAAVNAHWNG